MDWDDERPKKAKQAVVGEPLTDFSIEDLRLRIEALQAEIQRVEVELRAKQEQGAAAANFFK